MRIHNRAHRHSIIVTSAVNQEEGLKEEQLCQKLHSCTQEQHFKTKQPLKRRGGPTTTATARKQRKRLCC